MEEVSTRRPRAVHANDASRKDADAARSDEQSDDDQHDAVHDSTAKQSNNACDHENDRDQPEYELHASISLEKIRVLPRLTQVIPVRMDRQTERVASLLLTSW